MDQALILDSLKAKKNNKQKKDVGGLGANYADLAKHSKGGFCCADLLI